MNIRTVLMAIAATSAISTAAFAANTGHPSSREQMSERCMELQSQYNSAIEGKVGTPAADKASGLHAEGVNACQSNNTDIGVIKLEQALRELGVER